MRFKIGDLVRYGYGSTALMRITTVTGSGARLRYYGEQYFGASVGVYEADCTVPTLEDFHLWMRRDVCDECGKKLDNAVGCRLCIACSRREHEEAMSRPS